jgi:hypothetical protein
LAHKLVTWVGIGEPEAIASCFASKICILSFSSRPLPRSSSSLHHDQGTFRYSYTRLHGISTHMHGETKASIQLPVLYQKHVFSKIDI